VKPGFYNKAKPSLSNDSVIYELPGTVNGTDGTFQIGVRPSVSGNTWAIINRFSQPDK
jgi:hypothetical protein